jgi:hypothetical protein
MPATNPASNPAKIAFFLLTLIADLTGLTPERNQIGRASVEQLRFGKKSGTTVPRSKLWPQFLNSIRAWVLECAGAPALWI